MSNKKIKNWLNKSIVCEQNWKIFETNFFLNLIAKKRIKTIQWNQKKNHWKQTHFQVFRVFYIHWWQEISLWKLKTLDEK